MVRQALAERGVGRVDAAFAGWAKEIRHLVVCLPLQRLASPALHALHTGAHTGQADVEAGGRPGGAGADSGNGRRPHSSSNVLRTAT